MKPLCDAAHLVCAALATLSPERFPPRWRAARLPVTWLPGTCVAAWAALASEAFHRNSSIGVYWTGSKSATDHHLWCQDLQNHWNKVGLAASGPHVNLALMWSVSLKGGWTGFLFRCQNCPFHYFPAADCWPMRTTSTVTLHCYLGLLAPISNKLRFWECPEFDNLTSLSNFAPFMFLCVLPGDRYQSLGSPAPMKETKEKQDLPLLLVPMVLLQ